MIILLNTVCAEEDEASVSEHHQNHQNPEEGGSCAQVSFAQHQSVLMQTELVCLSITIITKKQGRGSPCWEGWASYSHVKCLLHVTVCCCHADLRQR